MRALVLLVLVGCSSFIDKQAATSTYRILVNAQDAAKRTSDVELARDAIPGGLMQLQAFALAYPKHDGFRRLYAEAICQYAVGFVFDDWEDAELTGRRDDATRIAARLTGLLGTCVDANLALLAPRWRAARADAAAWDRLIATAERAEAPPLLWIATADAVAIALEPMRGLAKLAPTLAALRRCVAIAPGAHDSDGELLLGSLEAGTSVFFGGADGSAQFDRARRSLGAGAVIVDVMYARGVAVARKDRELFRATLERALAMDVSRWPDRRLGNELALIKARRYLAAIDKLIPVRTSAK